MKSTQRVLAVVVLAIAFAACGLATEAPGGPSTIPNVTSSPSARTLPPTPSPGASPSPAESTASTPPTADPATVLAADGVGPYLIGTPLSELTERSLVANVEDSLHCDDSWQSAGATGRFAGQLFLTFHLGRLTDVATDSPGLVTPSGARVGMSLTELQGIYGSRGEVITGVNGNQAFSVRVPATTLGIVFYLDASNTTARAISAGEVERLEQIAFVGEGC